MQIGRSPGKVCSSCLLRCNDGIEFDFKLRTSGGEQVVIDIRDDGLVESGYETAQCAYRVRPRFPARQRFREGVNLAGGWREFELPSEIAHDLTKNVAITAIFDPVSVRFKIAITTQDRKIIRAFAVRLEYMTNSAENSLFPVNQRAIAIEGEQLKAAKIEHVRNSGLLADVRNETRLHCSFLAAPGGSLGSAAGEEPFELEAALGERNFALLSNGRPSEGL